MKDPTMGHKSVIQRESSTHLTMGMLVSSLHMSTISTGSDSPNTALPGLQLHSGYARYCEVSEACSRLQQQRQQSTMNALSGPMPHRSRWAES